MCVVAGVGFKTLFRLEYKDVLIWERIKKITEQSPGYQPDRVGDGRVPAASAVLEYVGTVRYIRAVHGAIPNTPDAYADAMRWLAGNESLRLPDSIAGALIEHLGAGDSGSVTPALDGTEAAYADDPGYLDLEPAPPQRIAALEADLTAGRYPEFHSVSLL
jgi:hypothetical protein